MSLTPQDIVEVELRQAMRGYATADVDDLLRRVSETLEAKDSEIAELRSGLEQAEAKVAEAESSQRSVQQALVTAHAVADETIRKAEQEADELREGARRDLDVDADQARREIERIAEEGRAAQQRQREEFETARERLQTAYDQQRTELGERLDLLREQLAACEVFLRSHIEEQEQALDRILGRIEEVEVMDAPDQDALPPSESEGQPSQREPAKPASADVPDDSAVDDPGADALAVDDPASDDPVGEDPASDDPVGKDPVADEPAARDRDPAAEQGPDTDELPRVDVAAALAGSSHAQAGDVGDGSEEHQDADPAPGR